jgi:hypothetical protein
VSRREDEEDAKAVRRARKEKGRIPWETVRRDLDLGPTVHPSIGTSGPRTLRITLDGEADLTPLDLFEVWTLLAGLLGSEATMDDSTLEPWQWAMAQGAFAAIRQIEGVVFAEERRSPIMAAKKKPAAKAKPKTKTTKGAAPRAGKKPAKRKPKAAKTPPKPAA